MKNLISLVHSVRARRIQALQIKIDQIFPTMTNCSAHLDVRVGRVDCVRRSRGAALFVGLTASAHEPTAGRNSVRKSWTVAAGLGEIR
jgi:hypothetical protein